MVPDSKPVDEREATDEALRRERENADRALAAERAIVNAGVDEIVHLARDDADARVSAAREQVGPAPSRQVETPEHLNEAVAELRAIEDEALADERATVDEVLRIEREHARALAIPAADRARPDRPPPAHRAQPIRRGGGAPRRLPRDGQPRPAKPAQRDLVQRRAAGPEQRWIAGEPAGGGTNVERIRRYSARMNRLIGDLVDVTSIDAGKLSVALRPGDPATAIAEALELFRDAATAKQIALVSRVEPGRVSATQFDPDRLLQVLANLISNSIKFTPAGGRVVIEAERQGEQVRFAVTDSGAGIAAHLLERIFERFWQVGENDNRGMGLGLYISRCIVVAHGGTIWAESEQAKYSTVYFTLPVA
jgi:signal transduction histidine kinase